MTVATDREETFPEQTFSSLQLKIIISISQWLLKYSTKVSCDFVQIFNDFFNVKTLLNKQQMNSTNLWI